MGTGNQEATPLVYNGVMYVPEPGDYIQAIDAKTGDLLWEYQRKLPDGVSGGTNRNMAIWGTTLIDASADNQIYALDARTGKLVWETPVLDPKKRASASSGPIIANGKVITGRQCQPDAGNDACIITAHDAKTGKELWRTRTIPRPGEPGYETWGDVPMDERWHVGTWMVPSYDPETEPDLRRHVGDDPGAEVHARRQRQAAPLPQLHAGAERRHRQDRLVLPARRRSLGSRSSVRAAARRHRRRARTRSEVPWINPRIKPGEKRKVITGIPGKTGDRLHARSADRRVPVGAADGDAERHQQDRRRHRRGDGQSRDARSRKIDEEQADLPEQQRRQELAGRRLQPADAT